MRQEWSYSFTSKAKTQCLAHKQHLVLCLLKLSLENSRNPFQPWANLTHSVEKARNVEEKPLKAVTQSQEGSAKISGESLSQSPLFLRNRTAFIGAAQGKRPSKQITEYRRLKSVNYIRMVAEVRQLPTLKQLLSLFFFSNSWHLKKNTGPYFIQCPSTWMCLIFLWLDWGYAFWTRTPEVTNYPSQGTTSGGKWC